MGGFFTQASDTKKKDLQELNLVRDQFPVPNFIGNHYGYKGVKTYKS